MQQCVYLGMTSKRAKERFEQHITGYRNNKGHKLSSNIVRNFNPSVLFPLHLHPLKKLGKMEFKLNSIEEAKKYKIGVIREDATEQVLKESGFRENNIHLTTKIKYSIGMLQLNRIDLLAYDEKSFFSLLRKENYNPEEFEVVFLLKEEKDYYAFHKGTSDSLIQRFQEALDSLKKGHNKLLDHYFKD